MAAIGIYNLISRYTRNFTESVYNLLGIKEISLKVEGEAQSCLMPVDSKPSSLEVSHKEPLAHLVAAPSPALRTVDKRIRREMIFSLSSCANGNCPLGSNPVSCVARTFVKDKFIEALSRFQRNEITIASYGSGGLSQDFTLLFCLPPALQIRKITYVLIDPIYRDQPSQTNFGSFTSLLEEISDKTGVTFEVFAFPSVEEYSMGDQNRPDLIMDVDTMLLEDDVTSAGCDFQRLVRMLNDKGELISLNVGGQAFLKSYPRDEPFHFHSLPQVFQLFGVPRLFHLRKEASLEIVEVQEYNPANREMAKI